MKTIREEIQELIDNKKNFAIFNVFLEVLAYIDGVYYTYDASDLLTHWFTDDCQPECMDDIIDYLDCREEDHIKETSIEYLNSIEFPTLKNINNIEKRYIIE